MSMPMFLKKNGQFIDEASSLLVQKCKSSLEERAAQNPHEDPVAMEQSVYLEVVGGDKPVRIRGYGLGVTPTMARWCRRGNMTEQEVERRVRSRLEECLRQQEERMNAKMGDMFKQFQSMQSKYEAQIAKLQANMDGFNTFQRFMTRNVDDFAPSTSLGYGTTPLPNPNQDHMTQPRGQNVNIPSSANVVPVNGAPTNANLNQFNFPRYGFGGAGVRSGNTSFDHMTQPRGQSVNIPSSANVVPVNGAPTNENLNQFNFPRYGFGGVGVRPGNTSFDHMTQPRGQSVNILSSANVVPVNGAPTNENLNQFNFPGYGFGGVGVRPGNTSFDHMTQPRGQGGNSSSSANVVPGNGVPTNASLNQLNFMVHGSGSDFVIPSAQTNANRSQSTHGSLSSQSISSSN